MSFDASQIDKIHKYLINRFGIEKGYKDRDSLKSICVGMERQYNNKEIYPTIFEKSAYLFEGIIRLHPVIDGNKRTALASFEEYLLENNHLFIKPLGSVRFTIKVARITNLENDSIQTLINNIVKWIRFRTVHITETRKAIQIIEVDIDMLEKLRKISIQRNKPELVQTILEYWIGSDIYPDSINQLKDILSYYKERLSEIKSFMKLNSKRK